MFSFKIFEYMYLKETTQYPMYTQYLGHKA